MRNPVRDGYDALGDRYAESRADQPRIGPALRAFRAALPADPRAIDAGCGPGTTLSHLPDPIGVDVSAEQLRLARDEAPDAGLLQGDVARLPVAESAVDGVIALWSLIHVPDTRRALTEFARVIRPGGAVLLLEGTDAWTGSNPDWLDAGVEMRWSMDGAVAVRRHLREIGFEITDAWRVTERLDPDDESDADTDDASDADADDASADEANDASDTDDTTRRDDLVRIDPETDPAGDTRPWTLYLATLPE